MVEAFKPTDHRVRKSIKRMSGTDLNESSGYEQPSDTESGVREAKLEKIKLKDIAKNGWHVKLKNGVVAKVKSTNELGVESLPDGEVKNGYLYPSEDTFYKVVVDSSGKVSHIVGTQIKDLDTSTPVGATRIVRGDGEVIIGQNQLKLSTKDSTIEIIDGVIRINAQEVYINETKIE